MRAIQQRNMPTTWLNGGKMAQIYNENMQKFMKVRSDMHIYLLFLLVPLVYYIIMCIVCYLIIECGHTH
jgi:hypothetical protein